MAGVLHLFSFLLSCPCISLFFSALALLYFSHNFQTQKKDSYFSLSGYLKKKKSFISNPTLGRKRAVKREVKAENRRWSSFDFSFLCSFFLLFLFPWHLTLKSDERNEKKTSEHKKQKNISQPWASWDILISARIKHYSQERTTLLKITFQLQ